MNNWKDKIATMILVKQELMKQDVEKIWPHHFPEVGANEKSICTIEQELGYKLDSMYRDFFNMPMVGQVFIKRWIYLVRSN